MGEFTRFILAVGVHDGDAVGQGFGAQVVVEDHHIRALCGGNGTMREGAAVNANDQVVIFGERFHRGLIRAIAFINAIRNIERCPMAHSL